nr:AAA family ATPase [uncultured Campylobacter sp.]
MRKISISNYRNIGIDAPAELKIPQDGGLIVLLGENNVGKSNVLSAIATLQNVDLNKGDRPNFFDFDEHNKTRVTLTEDILNEPGLDSEIDENLFQDKIFGVIFTQKSLETISKKQNLTTQQYIQNLNDKFNTSDICALHDYDEKEQKEEIRIILPEHKEVYLCSTKRGGEMLECFGVIDKDFDKVKNHDKAIKLSCKLKFISDKQDTEGIDLDDARELKKYLNDKFKNSDDKNIENLQKYEFKIWLDSENIATWSSSYPWFKTLTKIKNEFKKLTDWYNENYKENRYMQKNKEIFDELSKDINSAIFHREYNKFERYYDRLREILTELWEHNKQAYYHNNQKPELPKFIDIKALADELLWCYPTVPNIVFYKEHEIKNENLKTTPDQLLKNKFFIALFNAIKFYISKLQKIYKKSKDKGASFYNTAEKEINKILKETINRRFNELYYSKSDSDVYNFEIKLETQSISFCIEKNNETISLSEQSVGFKKFFNLFFNFLYQYKVGYGDIVLIDEVENHLSIPAQKDIRKFLKEFGQKRGITFIVSTHSNHILDIRHLDEIRIVKSSGKGSTIVNDFSIIPDHEADTLAQIKRGLGVEYLSLVGYDDKLIFVEGITDYNYLTAMNFLYEKEHGGKERLLFLPINGLGKMSTIEQRQSKINMVVAKDQKNIANELKTLARTAKDDRVLLLVDGDKAGEAMTKLNDDKFIAILNNEQFKEKYPNFKEIEDFFSDELRNEFEMNEKSSDMSSKFKNEVEQGKIKIDEETKDKFFELFNYLSTF